MQNSDKCIKLTQEIGALESKIKEREKQSVNGVSLLVPVADGVTDENTIKLQKLKEEYDLIC